MNPKINRRMLLRWSMLAGAGGWPAACAPASPNRSGYANAGRGGVGLHISQLAVPLAAAGASTASAWVVRFFVHCAPFVDLCDTGQSI